MAYQSNVLEVRFKGLEQKLGPRHNLVPGRLVTAENVLQTKTGTYRKRNGFFNTFSSNIAGGGSLSAAYDLRGAGGIPCVRGDTDLYSYDTANSSWIDRGAAYRTAVSRKQMSPMAGKWLCSAFDSVKNRLYAFGANGSTAYMSLYDVTSGEVIISSAPITMSGYTGGPLKAVYDPGTATVFLFSYASGFVFCWRIPTSTNTTSPSQTSIATVTAGTFYGMDVAVGGVNGIVVLLYGTNTLNFGGGASSLHTGFVTTATGLIGGGVPTGRPTGAVTVDCQHAVLAKNDVTSAVWIAAAGQAAGNLSWFALKCNASTLALSQYFNWAPGTTAASTGKLSACAYATGSTSLTIVASRAEPTSVEDMVLGLTTITPSGLGAGSASTTDNWKRASWCASDPFQVGSTWYFIRAHDAQVKGQNAYYLQEIATSGTIRGRVLANTGGTFSLGAQASYSSTFLGAHNGTVGAYVSGNKARMALQHWEFGEQYGSTFVEWDLSPTLGPMTQDGGSLVIPSAWPMMYQGGVLAEQAPCMRPRSCSGVASAGGALPAGAYVVAVAYSTTLPDGSFIRSDLCPVVSVTAALNQKITITYPHLRFTNATTAGLVAPVNVEIYCSKVDSLIPRLVAAVANSAASDSGTYVVSTEPADTAEAAYTSGDALAHSPTPPFRASFAWRGRTFLLDTDVEGDVWPSQEIRPGHAVEFSAILAFKITGGTGRLRAGGAIDDNYAAIMRRDAIFVLSGPGPDPFGVGNYTPAKLAHETGCENPASCVSTPIGLMFQAIDGGIWLLGRDLSLTYIGRGVDDFKTTTITAAVHDPAAQHVRFHAGTNILVFDYGNPTAEDPLGQWYVWTGQAAAVGATVISDVHHHISSTGTMVKYFTAQWVDVAITSYLPKMKLAKLRPAGLRGRFVPWRLQLIGNFVSSHTLQVTVSYNDGDTSQVFTQAVAAGPEEFELALHAGQLVTDLEITIEQTGSPTTEGFSLDGLMLEYGLVSGMKRGVTRLST